MVSAAAKINWTLDILSVDERGYHNLDMLMQRISLYDTIYINKEEGGIKLSSSLRWLPCDEKNTAYKSARLFYEKIEKAPECNIYIKKSIPSGAGLAGGSADSAAVLKGLNYMYGNPLKNEELDELALQVGADVPFMLRNGLYRAKGIGEKLERVSLERNYPLLLVMNKYQPASTKRVYGLYDEIGSTASPDTDGFIKALRSGNMNMMRSCGGNVLTESAVRIAPDILKNIEGLKEVGAQYAAMTGSGSVAFGVFKTREQAEEAKRRFGNMWCFSCVSFAGGIKIKENCQ